MRFKWLTIWWTLQTSTDVSSQLQKGIYKRKQEVTIHYKGWQLQHKVIGRLRQTTNGFEWRSSLRLWWWRKVEQCTKRGALRLKERSFLHCQNWQVGQGWKLSRPKRKQSEKLNKGFEKHQVLQIWYKKHRKIKMLPESKAIFTFWARTIGRKVLYCD